MHNGRVSLKDNSPVLYASIKQEQNRLRAECAALPKITRLCPYCGSRITDVAKGDHGYAFAKCSKCGEEVVFSPVHFRMAR